jgi:uncharacterized SAM-binding protein YcdF (DUF218 family)
MSLSPRSKPRRRFGALLTRRERWGLSGPGWVLILVLALSAAWGFVLNICPFLAVTQRVQSDVLVVEGWLPENLVHTAAEEFTSGNYTHLFTSGGGWSRIGDGDVTRTWASVGANRLRAAGVSPAAIHPVPCRFTERDRTYISAVAIRDWFRDHHIDVRSINVVTEGLHARRTRLLFQKAFGKDVSVGVIALSGEGDHWKRWYHYSDDVREVIGETVGYLYAKLFSVV